MDVVGVPSAIKWESNGVCDGRCNRIREGVGVVRICDVLLTKKPFLTAQMRSNSS